MLVVGSMVDVHNCYTVAIARIWCEFCGSNKNSIVGLLLLCVLFNSDISILWLFSKAKEQF